MGIGDLVTISQVPRDHEVSDGPSVPPPQAPPPTAQDPIAHDEPIIQEQEQDPPQSDVVSQPQVDDAVDPRDRLDRIFFGENDAIEDGSALDDEPNVVHEPEWVEPIETPTS